MDVITRTDAAEKGLSHFYTGRPCKRGHDRERAVATGACLGCLAVYARANNEKYRTKQKESAMGLNPLTVTVRADQMPKVEAFVALLTHAIVVGTAPPLVPHQDDVDAVNGFITMLNGERGIATPAPAQYDPYPTWVRVHGVEIADQMRAAGAA